MQKGKKGGKPSFTGLLLHQREIVPIRLHAVPQRHPELRLFGRRHALPSLLDAGERGVRDGVGGGIALLLFLT